MAEFHEGFVFECDVSGLLTIEGNPIPVTPTANGGFSAKLPHPLNVVLEATTRSQLAKMYIDRSEALKLRRLKKEEHLQQLRKGWKDWNQWRREERHTQPMLARLRASEFEGV